MRQFFAVLLLLCASQAAAADDVTSLILTYQVAPADRPAVRQDLREKTLPKLAALKAQGILADFHVLASRYVDDGMWDFMAILNFASAQELERWKEVELADPAGLDAALLRRVSRISSTPAGLIRHAGTRSKTPIFLVIPYQYLVSAADYVSYLDGYTLPQFMGWIGEQTLAEFSVYLSRYPAGRPWNAMLILEYQDAAALADRDRVVALVRARLKENPDWKTWSDNKKAIRDERQAVVADEMRPLDR